MCGVRCWGFWFTVMFVVAALGSWSLRCQPQVWQSPAQCSPQVLSYQGQVDEGRGAYVLLNCSSHNPEGHRYILNRYSCKDRGEYKYNSSGTCVSISCGMVCCWIQGWTSASSSLCSWLNQGWRGWSTLSFSLSSANTSLWSLWEIFNDPYIKQLLCPVKFKLPWTAQKNCNTAVMCMVWHFKYIFFCFLDQ